MNVLRIISVCLTATLSLSAGASAQIHLTATDEITVAGYCLDSAGFYIQPDSVRVAVYRDGLEQHDAWYNAADQQCALVNGALVFSDQFGDIDNDAGDGLYQVMAGFYEHDCALYRWQSLWVYLGVDIAQLNLVYDSITAWYDDIAQIAAIHDSLQSQDDWVSSLTASELADTLASRTDSYPRTNVVQLASSTTAAGNLEDCFDNDGLSLVDVDFRALDITNGITANIYGSVDSVLTPVAATASVDSTSVARAVWNSPQAHHTSPGSFGSYLDAPVSGVGSGSGAYSISIVAYDQTSSQPVPNAGVAVRNVDQTILIAAGSTDYNGLASFNLDPGSFLVSATAPGYIFNAFDTVQVTGPVVDTLFAVRFDPGLADNPALCRVNGAVYSVQGIPEVGAVVRARLTGGVSRVSSLVISPISVETVTDSTGYFFLDLIPSALLTPAAGEYEITITRNDGAILRKRVLVPNAPTWTLNW